MEKGELRNTNHPLLPWNHGNKQIETFAWNFPQNLIPRDMSGNPATFPGYELCTLNTWTFQIKGCLLYIYTLKYTLRDSGVSSSLSKPWWTPYFARVLLSVTRSCLTLQPHGLKHTSPPCPSPSPRACPSSCPSSHLILCHPLLLCQGSGTQSCSCKYEIWLTFFLDEGIFIHLLLVVLGLHCWAGTFT